MLGSAVESDEVVRLGTTSPLLRSTTPMTALSQELKSFSAASVYLTCTSRKSLQLIESQKLLEEKLMATQSAALSQNSRH